MSRGTGSEHPGLHAGGRKSKPGGLKTPLCPAAVQRTCRGRGIREPLFLPVAPTRSETPNTAGHPASPGPPSVETSPRRQRTSMSQDSGAFGVCAPPHILRDAGFAGPQDEAGGRGAMLNAENESPAATPTTLILRDRVHAGQAAGLPRSDRLEGCETRRSIEAKGLDPRDRRPPDQTPGISAAPAS